MKAIIPVAGAGTKLRPHTYTQHKALIPLAGKPLLSYIIDDLSDNGVQSFAFIIGYLGEKIKQFVEEYHPDIEAQFIDQNERKGTAHAVGLAKDFIGSDEAVIVYGDTIVEIDFKSLFTSQGNHVCVGKVPNPSDFGIVETEDGSAKAKGFAEKPSIPKSNLALVGMFKIADTDIMFDQIEKLMSDEIDNQERSFTLVLQKMYEQGCEFCINKVDRWFDCGRKETLLETNQVLLQKKADLGQIKTYKFPGTIITQPVEIGEKTEIENCIIGPYTSIGDNVVLRNCIISNGIIGAFTTLENINLSKSLIGSDVIIKGSSQELNIGDNTEIDFS